MTRYPALFRAGSRRALQVVLVAISLVAGRTHPAEGSPASASRDLVSLARPAWFWSSIPFDSLGNSLPSFPADHAGIQWYNPRGVKRGDLNPALTEENGKSLEVTALEINVLAPAGDGIFTPVTWTGLAQPLPRALQDFTINRYLEIWVNDRRPDHSLTHAVLHLDLGRIAEDAFWQVDSMPNHLMDTEDRNLDLRLDPDEDTGLDGLFNAEEPGYDPDANPDPNDDDYEYSLDRPLDYSHINGTEGSGQGALNGTPDTEDLNLNGALDFANDYYEATLDLSDTVFVVIDVLRDYAGDPDVDPDNGWRLYRIPVSSPPFGVIGAPNWGRIETCRLWLGGMTGPTNIQITGLRVVGDFAPEPAAPALLYQNRPNPFNPGTTIRYDLSEDAQVRLSVFDLQGRLVRELVDGMKAAGPHFETWSGADEQGRAVASGVYFYRLEAAGKTATRRMVLAR